MIKAIPTRYHGIKFRSRLEAKWAVFFDACGVDWSYEPEGYSLLDGECYLPDFLLKAVPIHKSFGNSNEIIYEKTMDLYIEVKGKMHICDAKKLHACVEKNTFPFLIVGDIPKHDTSESIDKVIFERAYKDFSFGMAEFNSCYIDGDEFGLVPGISQDGKFGLFGHDGSYTQYLDLDKTEKAYDIARNVRFDHGYTPTYQQVIDMMREEFSR